INRTWAATAAGFRAGHTPAEAERFAALPQDVRADFENGAINPHFVQLAVIAPDYFRWSLTPRSSLTPYTDTLGEALASVAAAAPEAETLVLSVPHGAYTQAEAHAALVALGFDLPETLLTDTTVDDVVREAAEGADLTLVTATDAFRASDGLAFYPVDGHFNPWGNQLLAESIYDDVRAACLR
ncbi:MAG: hypothetical protein AAF125_10665, partial [Chloroflexota bacterium]